MSLPCSAFLAAPATLAFPCDRLSLARRRVACRTPAGPHQPWPCTYYFILTRLMQIHTNADKAGEGARGLPAKPQARRGLSAGGGRCAAGSRPALLSMMRGRRSSPIAHLRSPPEADKAPEQELHQFCMLRAEPCPSRCGVASPSPLHCAHVAVARSGVRGTYRACGATGEALPTADGKGASLPPPATP